MATTYSQLGTLKAERGGTAGLAIGWHVKALAIRLRLRLPQAVNNLRRSEQFAGLLAQATSGTELAGAIASLLDELGAAGAGGP